MKRIAILLVLALACARVASAQTGPTILVGQNFSVAATHDGLNMTGGGYRLLQDGAQVGPDAGPSTLTNGTITLPGAPFTARGVHQIQMVAFNPDKPTGNGSAVLFVSVQIPGPNAPGLPTLILAIVPGPNGTLAWKALAVHEDGTVGPWEPEKWLGGAQ